VGGAIAPDSSSLQGIRQESACRRPHYCSRLFIVARSCGVRPGQKGFSQIGHKGPQSSLRLLQGRGRWFEPSSAHRCLRRSEVIWVPALLVARGPQAVYRPSDVPELDSSGTPVRPHPYAGSDERGSTGGGVATPQLPGHSCPVCGRRIAATTTSLYVTRRDGKLIRYAYLRLHKNSQGHPCPVPPPPSNHPPSPVAPGTKGPRMLQREEINPYELFKWPVLAACG
jgi:hypothetical protein